MYSTVGIFNTACNWWDQFILSHGRFLLIFSRRECSRTFIRRTESDKTARENTFLCYAFRYLAASLLKPCMSGAMAPINQGEIYTYARRRKYGDTGIRHLRNRFIWDHYSCTSSSVNLFPFTANFQARITRFGVIMMNSVKLILSP